MKEPESFVEALAQRHTEDTTEELADALACLSVKHGWTKEQRSEVIEVLMPVINHIVLRTCELIQEATQESMKNYDRD